VITRSTVIYAGVSQSYRAAAQAVNGLVLPAGIAWRLVLQRHRELGLYSEDGLHPTEAGTYLAALVIYQGLYDRPPRGLAASRLAPSDVARLQAAAREALAAPK
jgi:hypothetical protein